MITYADIQRIYRNEKASVELQKVEDCFYSDSMDLVSKIDEVNKAYVERMINEIFDRRRNKIVLFSLRAADKEPVNMVTQEKVFFLGIAKLLNEYKSSALADSKGIEPATMENIRPVEKTKLKFLTALPAIIGTDMVHYGPFHENDIAELPKENAEILIEQNAAEEIE